MTTDTILSSIRPGRKILGHSAVLLPITSDGQPDLDYLAQRLKATRDAGLIPAVNMDTGYVNLLSEAERLEVLRVTQTVLEGAPFLAGAFIQGMTGEPLSLYMNQCRIIRTYGGIPILFQCDGIRPLSMSALINLHRLLGAEVGSYFLFELGDMFAPFGQIYPLDTVRGLMELAHILGMKHSSLRREQEWKRLRLRDELRPDFLVMTGNDLAIDMVMFGSDYLLGLSAFHSAAFALRDRLWELGHPGFFELNDALQALGSFAFRPPVPAYKHSCAQFLRLRGEIPCSEPHPSAIRRPDSDEPILQEFLLRIDSLVNEFELAAAPQTEPPAHLRHG